MSQLYIFYCDVEWSIFNRREFIISFSKTVADDDIVIAINRPADIITSFLKPAKGILKLKQSLNKKSKIETINSKLILIRPWSIIHEIVSFKLRLPALNRLNTLIIKHQITSAIDVTQFDKIVFWAYEQIQWPLLRMFKNSFNVWEIFDDYRLKHDGTERNIWIKQEPRMLGSTNLIFTLTNCIKKKYVDVFKDIYVLGNGFDPSLFKLCPDEKLDIEKISSPKCCYLGNIRNWIDIDLTIEIIKENRDINFVFIGPIDKSGNDFCSDIKNFNNVFFLGSKERNEINSYMQNVDIGFIPYVQTSFTKCVKPIKICEFLASGTPVLTTVGADYEEKIGVLEFFQNSHEFRKKFTRMTKNNNSSKCRKESEQYSWNAIAMNAWQTINNNL